MKLRHVLPPLIGLAVAAVVAACTLNIPAARIAGIYAVNGGAVQTFTATITSVTPIDVVADAGAHPDATADATFPDAFADAGTPDLGFPDAAAPDAAPADSGAPPSVAVCDYPDSSTVSVIHYCPTGDDNNPGTLAQPKASLAQFTSDISWGVSASTSFLFCRGGVWTHPQVRIRRVEDPALTLFVGAYGDPQANLPEWHTRVQFDNGVDGNPPVGGVTFRDLALRGAKDVSTFGIFTFRQVRNIQMCNLDIRDFGVGVHLAQTSGANFGIYNSTITDNLNCGFLGGGQSVTIQNNRFRNNGFATGTALQGHNVYLASWARDVLIEGNHSIDNGFGASGGCETVHFTLHGSQQENVRVVNNRIEEVVGTAQPGCWGIGIDAASSGATGCLNCEVTNNFISNVGNAAIALQNTQGIVVRGNTVVHSASMSFGTRGILAPSRTPWPGAIPLAEMVMEGNVFDLDGGSTCLPVDPAVVAFSDLNSCAAGSWSSSGDLATWRLLTGQDANSSFTQR